MESLFFSLMKRTKNQGFILFTPEMLILSVICYAASVKSLTFHFVHKTQQSQDQRKKGNLEWTIELFEAELVYDIVYLSVYYLCKT